MPEPHAKSRTCRPASRTVRIAASSTRVPGVYPAVGEDAGVGCPVTWSGGKLQGRRPPPLVQSPAWPRATRPPKRLEDPAATAGSHGPGRTHERVDDPVGRSSALVVGSVHPERRVDLQNRRSRMDGHLQLVLCLGKSKRGRGKRTRRNPSGGLVAFSREPVPRPSPASGLAYGGGDLREAFEHDKHVSTDPGPAQDPGHQLRSRPIPPVGTAFERHARPM